MKRALRFIGPLLFVSGLLGLLTACASPTAPELPDGAPLGPAFVVRPPDAGQQAAADAWWLRQAACVGVSPAVAVRVPVDVVPDAFDCGGVVAAGCMQFARITVVARWFEPALSHELIHYALWKKGEADIGHSNPAFPRCDVLNVGQLTDGGVQ